MKDSGLVVIDDFHRLPDNLRSQIADFLKLLADEERPDSKIVVLGINRAGESLIQFARDLAGRLDAIKFEPNHPDRIRELVREGARTLNVQLPDVEIASKATGSFHIAQLLCHAACIASNVQYRTIETQVLTKSFRTVLERVMDDLSMSFMEIAMTFATGPDFSREGRAPYLQVLQWLAQSHEWTVNIDRELQRHPESRPAITAILNPHLPNFLSKNEDLAAHIHFDQKTHVLAVEDPKFFFFIKNLEWAKFSERVGYLNLGFKTKYDFALSFAGPERATARKIAEALIQREFAIFYDFNEQERILAADIEEYLAPIYQSEATFVLCMISPSYPERVWTRFESKQFKSRFGTETVIPIWIESKPGPFDQAGRVGGYFLRPEESVDDQVELLAELLKRKIAEYRLAPRPKRGEFLCRYCHLMLNISSHAEGRTSVCVDCAHKYPIQV